MVRVTVDFLRAGLGVDEEEKNLRFGRLVLNLRILKEATYTILSYLYL
jgi:hypothetical protein